MQHGPNIGIFLPLLASQHNGAKDGKKGPDPNPGGHSLRAELDARGSVLQTCTEPNDADFHLHFRFQHTTQTVQSETRTKTKANISTTSRCDRLTRDTPKPQSSLVARYLNPRGNNCLWIYPQQLRVTLREVYRQSISQSRPKREPPCTR